MPAANSTFTIGGVSFSADSLIAIGIVVAESSVLRFHSESFRDGENRRLRQARNRYKLIKTTINLDDNLRLTND